MFYKSLLLNRRIIMYPYMRNLVARGYHNNSLVLSALDNAIILHQFKIKLCLFHLFNCKNIQKPSNYSFQIFNLLAKYYLSQHIYIIFVSVNADQR